MLRPSGRPQVRKCTSVPFGALGGRVAEGLPVRGLKQVRDRGLAGKLGLEGSQEVGHGVAGFGLQLASLWEGGVRAALAWSAGIVQRGTTVASVIGILLTTVMHVH